MRQTELILQIFRPFREQRPIPPAETGIPLCSCQSGHRGQHVSALFQRHLALQSIRQ